MFLLHLQWTLQPRIVCVLIWISNNNLAAAALLTCKIPKYIIDVHSQSCFHSLKEIVWPVFNSRIIPTCHPLLIAKSFCLVLQAIWYNNLCTFYFFLLNKVLLIYKPYICIIAEWIISARAPSVFISCSLANVPHSSPFQYCHVSIAIYDPQCQLNIAGLYKIGCSNHQPRVPSCPECILIIIKFNMACV